MTSTSPQVNADVAGIKALRLAVVSDAAPERNGVGAYYQDLVDCLTPYVEQAQVFSPTIEEGVWKADLVLPMPGDDTQKLCFPNPISLQRELAALNPHVVIIPTPGVYGMTGAVYAGRHKVPMLAGFHTSFEALTDLYWQDSLKGRFYTWYLETSHQYLFRRSKRVLVNSEDMFDLATRMGSDRIERIGTPLPVAFSRHPVTNHSGNVGRVLFAGRLAAEKNIEAVLAAAAALPDIQFSIAGDGPQRAEVEAAVAKTPNLDYLGWQNRESLRDQVDAHDMLVLPSHFESFGTIALEAMSRRRLVIVSRGCGISNWPQLTRGMKVIGENETLIDTLGAMTALTTDERLALADTGYQAAMEFDQQNLDGWEQLLLEVTR